MPLFDQTPDKPESFGFKISWFALKTTDPAAAVDALELKETTPSNWASSLAAVYGTSDDSDPWLFVSPPLSGWVLVVGASLPYPTDETHQDMSETQRDIGRRFDALFSRLMKRFDDVQFFGSHRVVDFVAWARALKGKPTRSFAWSGSEGVVAANFGEQTPEEAKLKFINLTGLSPPDAGDKIFEIAGKQQDEADALVASGLSRREAQARVRQNGRGDFPSETDVVELAALWSIDPSRLEDQDHPVSLGLAARLPKNLSQSA
jgi:hypothetical protein